MNTNFFEKVFGPGFFVALNILIILAVELTGEFFYRTGLLHVIALLFVLLAVIRFYINYKTYDQFLDKIKYASVVALLIFAISHIAEYVNFVIYFRYDDAVFATTINFYLIGLAAIAIGTELFFIKYDRKSNLSVQILYVLAIALAVYNIAISLRHELISLEPDRAYPYIYFVLAAILLAYAIKNIIRVRNKISISVGFLNYLIGSLSFIAAAMAPNIFYEVLEEKLHVPMFQIMYISHFAFFVSLSLMFLSYKKFSNLKGIYEDAEKIIQKKS